jgi:hypothetical protein
MPVEGVSDFSNLNEFTNNWVGARTTQNLPHNQFDPTGAIQQSPTAFRNGSVQFDLGFDKFPDPNFSAENAGVGGDVNPAEFGGFQRGVDPLWMTNVKSYIDSMWATWFPK